LLTWIRTGKTYLPVGRRYYLSTEGRSIYRR